MDAGVLLDPAEHWPILTGPTALSPSSISEFLACPQSFLFQYIFKLKQPTNLALLKGRLCHTALEQLYDLPPINRTENALHNLFRRAYRELRNDHIHLFNSMDDEVQWGKQSLELLSAYWKSEDATCVQPARREVWVSAHLDALAFETGATNEEEDFITTANATANAINSTFLVRGIVDRLDVVRGAVSSSQREAIDASYDGWEDPVVLAVVDYKTSQQPNLKYTPAVNERIRNQAFFQLQIYALLLHEQQQRREQRELDAGSPSSASTSEPTPSLPVRFLRLMYLKTPHARPADAWTLDLGATDEQRSASRRATKAALQDAHRSMSTLLDTQDPLAFAGCQRSFCYCHVCRPRFVPGTVWEPR